MSGNYKHGDAPLHGPVTPEYRSWAHIKSRCLNPKVHAYARYGGAGITICDAWANDYRTFLRDMGRRPSLRHSIHRIDGARGYEPGNCRWATPIEQNRSRRGVKITEMSAEIIRTEAAAGVSRRVLRERFGVSKKTIANILDGKSWVGNHV